MKKGTKLDLIFSKVLVVAALLLTQLLTGHAGAEGFSFHQSNIYSQYEHLLDKAITPQIGTDKLYEWPVLDSPFDPDTPFEPDDLPPGFIENPSNFLDPSTLPSIHVGIGKITLKIPPPEEQPYRRVDPILQEEVVSGIYKQNPGMKPIKILGTELEKNSCQVAIKAARKAEEDFYNALTPSAKRQKWKAYHDTLKHYDQKCLSKVPEPSPSAIESNAYQIVGIIGTVDPKNGEGIRDIWGIATYIGDKKIITARHCIFAKGYNPERKNKVFEKKVLFQRISNPSEQYKVSFVPGTNLIQTDAIKVDDDVLQLNIDRAIPGVKKPKFSSEVVIGTPLLIMGLIEHTLEESINSDAWIKKVRKQRLGACIVATATDSCLTHTCNTDWKFSGSPMIQSAGLNDVDDVTIIGIHVARSGTKQCTSLVGYSKRLNVGISSERICLLTGLPITN